MQAPIDNPATRLEAMLRRCARLASAVVISAGLLILTGWTGLIVIEGIVPWFRMPPISALLFVLSGIALWCSAVQQQTPALLAVSRVCAMLVIIAGSLNLAEYLFGLNFGFDTFGFRDINGPVSVSARMPYLTALNLLGIGSALLVVGNPRRIILFQTLILLVVVNAALGMSRNVFGGESLLPLQFMAHASTSAVILCVGLFCLRPRGGLVDTVMADRMRVRISMPVAYGLAVGLTGITLLAQLTIGTGFDEPMILVFTIPITLSAYLGGLGPGLLATLLSCLGAAYFLLPPIYSFHVYSATEYWEEMTLFLTGILTSIICSRLQQARADAEQGHIASARLAAIVAHSDDAIIGQDLNGIVASWNQGAERIFGYTSAEMVGQPIQRIIPPDRLAEENEILGTVSSGQSVHFETVRQTREGRLLEVSITVSPIKDAAGRIIGAAKIARDITLQKAHEHEIERLSWLYAALSQVNQAIVWTQDRDELFSRICRVLVEFGKLRMAWIGLLDPATHRVNPAGQYGDVMNHLQQVLIHVDEPDVRGPTGTAIREGRTYICNEIARDPHSGPWRDMAGQAGYRALAVLPIRQGGVVCGAINVYASEAGIFQDKEIALLEEAAVDVSFALDNIAREHARHISELRFRSLFDHAPDGIVIADPTGHYLDANAAICRMTGYSRGELITMHSTDLVAPVEIPFIEPALEDIKTGAEYRREWQFRRKDGSIFPADVSATRLPDGNPIGIIRDITERKQATIRINYLNRVYSILSGINTLIVRVRDRDELFSESCRIAVESGGFLLAWIGILDKQAMKIDMLASQGGTEEFLAAINARISPDDGMLPVNSLTARVVMEKKPYVSNDSRNDATLALTQKHIESGIRSMAMFPLIVANEGIGLLALYSGEMEFFHAEELKLLTELTGDIAFAIDNIAKAEKITYLAYYDELTGLANRSLLLERFEQYRRSSIGGGHKLAVLLFNLERFKNINDSLGRQSGDELLRQVAEWLVLRAGDGRQVARVSADNFAMILPEINPDTNMASYMEKFMQAFLEHSFLLNNTVYRISAKIGIALCPEDGADAATLFKNAEAALKKTKVSGERYLFYTRTMTESVAGKLSLENRLRQALEKKEFVLHYQPKVDLVNGRLSGAEALIRWNDPQTGLVPPGRFIPVLEETGLIYDVGRWALRQAIADYLRWRAAGLASVRIAVNVSPLQLRDRGFISDVQKAIGVDVHAAAGLELEITESLIMEDVRYSITSLQTIRNLGINIAIDDFGTGFSSLSYLSRLPVDTLKIDRSFIIDMTSGAEGLTLVSTIIKLAHSLKLKVVAEGVETEEQVHLLRQLGCEEMQGYLVSKPVAGDLFETGFLGPRIK